MQLCPDLNIHTDRETHDSNINFINSEKNTEQCDRQRAMRSLFVKISAPSTHAARIEI